MRRAALVVALLLGCSTSSELRTTDASTDAVDTTQCTGPLPSTCIFGSVPCPPTLDAARASNALCGAGARWITQDPCAGYTVVEAWGKDTSTALFYDANGLLAGVAFVTVNFTGMVRCLGAVPGFSLPLVPERNRLDCPVGTMTPACVDAGASGD